MKYLAELQSIKDVVSVSGLDLKAEVETLSNLTVREKLSLQLEKIEVYRLVYKVGKLKVIGYLTLPKEGDNLPCIIHLRGGNRDFSMITPRAVLMQMVNYAGEGYVVITTQYPGVEGGDGVDTHGGPDDLASIKKLRDVLKKISCADGGNIGMKGHSRGGLMIYMLLREVKWIKAAVMIGSPVDQFEQAKQRKNWREHQVLMWGKSKDEILKRSPLRYAEEFPKNVPLLIMHGGADWRVLAEHSFKMTQKLSNLAVPYRFMLFEGGDHGLTEYRTEYHRQVLDWFNRFLKQKEALPNLKLHGE